MGLLDTFNDATLGVFDPSTYSDALGGGLESLGLVPDYGNAMGAAEFNPYNINSSAGSLFYDPGSRTFSSMLSPDLMAQRFALGREMRGIDPSSQLALMREQAAPYEQAQYSNLENRLFSQGRLGHSQVNQPGGAMRGLFDSFANADLSRQLQASQWADTRRANLMNQLMGIQGMEGGLFSAAQGMGGLGMQGQQIQSQLMAQDAQFMPNLMGNLLTGGLTGYMMRPG